MHSSVPPAAATPTDIVADNAAIVGSPEPEPGAVGAGREAHSVVAHADHQIHSVHASAWTRIVPGARPSRKACTTQLVTASDTQVRRSSRRVPVTPRAQANSTAA